MIFEGSKLILMLKPCLFSKLPKIHKKGIHFLVSDVVQNKTKVPDLDLFELIERPRDV